MNTEPGKQIEERHRYMEGFLSQFYAAEWEERNKMSSV
jgi:hypothetical protein